MQAYEQLEGGSHYSALSDWFCQSPFGRPAQSESSFQRIVRNQEQFGPLYQRPRLTVVRLKMSRATISRLLSPRCPNAIAWLIITVIIHSFKRVFRGRFVSHVFQKAYECQPTFTNANTSSAIMAIGRILWIPAPTKHTGPRVVSRSATVVGVMSMLSSMLSGHLPRVAAAADNRSTAKTTCSYLLLDSAFAATEPKILPRSILPIKARHSQAAKDLALEVEMAFFYFVFRHALVLSWPGCV